MTTGLQVRRQKETAEELAEYQGFTFHAVRSELIPIQGAEYDLRQMLTSDPAIAEKIRGPLRSLKVGIGHLDFYLTHLLKFLHGETKPTPIKPSEIAEIIRREARDLQDAALGNLSVETAVDMPPEDSPRLMLDRDHLMIAVRELLRNADKAVFRRQQAEKRDGEKQLRGNVKVTARFCDADRHISSRHLCITVTDDGEAATNAEAQKELEAALQRTLLGLKESFVTQKGLAFLQWVVTKHGGYLEVTPVPGFTSLTMHLSSAG